MSNTVSRRGLFGMFAAGFAALPVGATAQRLNIINNTTGPVRAVEWQDLPNGERVGILTADKEVRAAYYTVRLSYLEQDSAKEIFIT